MMDGSCDFMARVWIRGDDVESHDVWCHELEPTDPKFRPSSNWASEFISLYDADFWRELVAKECTVSQPKEEGLQILLRAVLKGWTDYWGEYDEDMEVIDLKYEAFEGWPFPEHKLASES